MLHTFLSLIGIIPTHTKSIMPVFSITMEADIGVPTFVNSIFLRLNTMLVGQMA